MGRCLIEDEENPMDMVDIERTEKSMRSDIFFLWLALGSTVHEKHRSQNWTYMTVPILEDDRIKDRVNVTVIKPSLKVNRKAACIRQGCKIRV